MPEPTPPPPVNPFKKTSATAKRAIAFGVIAFLIAIVAGIFAWLSWQETQSLVKVIDSETVSWNKTTSHLQTQLKNLSKSVDAAENTLKQLTRSSIEAHNQRFFSEVTYLIHLANLQLTVSRNAQAALPLLQLAHKQLKQITSPGIAELENAINQDIIALQKAPKLDRSELLTRLESLKNDVQNLPSLPAKKAPRLTLPVTPDTAKTVPWYKKLDQVFSGFKDLVIIRHETKPAIPLLSPQRLAFLKENIQLKLSQAQWAILHKNNPVFHHSLRLAIEWLERYYPNEAAAADTLKALQSLLQINIQPKLPDLSDTLKALNATALHAVKSRTLQHATRDGQPLPQGREGSKDPEANFGVSVNKPAGEPQ